MNSHQPGVNLVTSQEDSESTNMCNNNNNNKLLPSLLVKVLGRTTEVVCPFMGGVILKVAYVIRDKRRLRLTESGGHDRGDRLNSSMIQQIPEPISTSNVRDDPSACFVGSKQTKVTLDEARISLTWGRCRRGV